MARSKTRFVLIAGLLSVLITALGGVLNVALTNMKRDPIKAAARVPSTAVTTIIAEKRDYRERLIGYGRARPQTVSEIAASVAGDVVWRSPRLEPGTYIEADTELVRIDNRDLKTAVAMAKSQLAQARFSSLRQEITLRKLGELKGISEEELATSKRSHERSKELMQESALSDEEFDSSLLQYALRQRALLEFQQQEELAKPEIERAQAEVEAAEANLEQAETNLARASISAPYSGIIDERMVNLGSRVAVGEQLFRMISTAHIEIPIALPASQYTVVRPGSRASVRFTEGGPVVWEGQVDRVSPMIDDQDRTFFVYLEIASEGKEPVVPAGAFVVAEIDGMEHEGIVVVPRTALIGDQLYVANAEGNESNAAIIEGRTPRMRRMLTNVALLESGVAPGERIVVTNVEKIGHGSRVVVIDRTEVAGTD